MIAGARMRLRDRLPRLDRLLVDPPHRMLRRAVETGLRSGLLEMTLKDPAAIARIAIREGLGIRSVHRLHAALDPNRPAIIDAHRTITYGQVDPEIDACAAALVIELGARRGVPVALMMENRAEYVLAWFALLRLGITTAHLSRYGTPDEIEPLLRRTAPRVVIVSEATLPVIEEVKRRAPDLPLRVVVAGDTPVTGGHIAWDELLSRHRGRLFDRPPRDGESDNVVYTSGTTGLPKAAVRDMKAMGAVELLRILERLPLHVGDRHLVVAPLYHSGAQAFTLINSSLGATIHLHEKFEAEPTLAALSREEINNVFLVPTMIHRVLDVPHEVHRRFPTPALHAIVSGAALVPTARRQRAVDRFGADAIFDFYGATELGWVTLCNGHEMLERPGTVGRPIPGQEIRIVDETGTPLPPGSVGKVFTRSAQLMRGYHRDDAATAESRAGDWATVDDLGYLDADGYLYLTGRARDMVISGGVNVYPVEVENALALHPSVREVAVIGLPDEEWGERLTAVIVPQGEADPEALAQWARERLAPYKVPRRWEMVDTLPRNPTGKILKRELRATFGA
jgi:acyl-CoA synthetase (AMP-forming)/AMP-acid ligase II